MELASVFTRYLPQVVSLHDSIRADVKKLEDFVEERERFTLLDMLLAGPKIKVFEDHDDYDSYKASIIRALKAEKDEMPSVNSWGVFDYTDISALKATYYCLQDWIYRAWEPLLYPVERITPCTLEDISPEMSAPSTLLSLKYFWLHCGFDKNQSFSGLLANTKPVRTALKELYGTDFGTPLRATLQQHRMAGELGIPELDAFNLNTVLWFKGQHAK